MDRLTKLREEIRNLLDKREQFQDDLDAILAGAEGRNNDSLTEAEQVEFDEKRDAIKTIDARRKMLEERVEDITNADEARKAAAASAERFGGTAPSRVRVTSDEPIYRKQGPNSFFQDAYTANYLQDYEARDRLARHDRGERTEQRASGSSNVGGLVVPQYLVSDFAPIARQGRPFADFVGSRPLPPDGMTLTVPRGNTGTLIASQTGENAALTTQDFTVSDLTVNVRTLGGYAELSRQSIERGTNVDLEVMSDLAAAYAAQLDQQLFHGSGSNGQHTGIWFGGSSTQTVTQTDARTQIRKVLEAISAIETNRYLAPNVVVVHPRRWAFWMSATDSDGRPIIPVGQYGTVNAFGAADAPSATGVRGSIFGLTVLADANISTALSGGTVGANGTEDAVFVTRASDLRLWENNAVPTRIRFDEPGSNALTVRIVGFDYSAWTSARYTSATRILSGTGFITPTF